MSHASNPYGDGWQAPASPAHLGVEARAGVSTKSALQ